jgi:cytochrome bd-type quinol oxidase subunit 1
LESQGRVYVPTQNANRKINQWLYQKYIVGNPAIQSKVRDGVRLLNDLLETAPIRPVTPVGQLLFNGQERATENAIFHKLSPQAALENANQSVQRQLDRALSPPRGPLVTWKYFIAVYLALIALCAAAIYWWETRRGGTGQRRWKARSAAISARSGAAAGSVPHPGSSASSF